MNKTNKEKIEQAIEDCRNEIPPWKRAVCGVGIVIIFISALGLLLMSLYFLSLTEHSFSTSTYLFGGWPLFAMLACGIIMWKLGKPKQEETDAEEET